jgi:hypothetical protein
MEEGIIFRKKLDSIATIVVIQVVAFAFGYGLQTAQLNIISTKVEAHEVQLRRAEEHIIRSQDKWENIERKIFSDK